MTQRAMERSMLGLTVKDRGNTQKNKSDGCSWEDDFWNGSGQFTSWEYKMDWNNFEVAIKGGDN